MQYFPNTDHEEKVSAQLGLTYLVDFLKEGWKTILGFMLLGIIISLIYFWVVPRSYESVAFIRMAQIYSSTLPFSNPNPLGVNIEEPQAVALRMQLPSSYPDKVVEACGLDNQANANKALVEKTRITIPRGVAGIIELRVQASSAELAENCLNSIFDHIKLSQYNLVKFFNSEAENALASDKARLKIVTEFISKVDKSGGVSTGHYFTARDEIRFLLEKIYALQDAIATNENRSTHFTAPVYVNPQPIFPKKNISLFVGLFFGFGFGFLWVIFRRVIQNSK